MYSCEKESKEEIVDEKEREADNFLKSEREG
jgi:hypothetical protein